MNKDRIRARVRARKALLTEQERQQAADAVFSRLEHSAAFLLAQNILMYHSLPDELSTLRFLERWSERKHFFLPRVNGVNLDILPYERTHMSMGAFHIEEPQGDDLTPIEDIDMVVVPAVAYDRKGNRVGRGKGFYDRLLHDTRAVRVGVGYDFQLLPQDDEIDDVAEHDVPVDMVITQSCHISLHRR